MLILPGEEGIKEKEKKNAGEKRQKKPFSF